VLDTIIEITDRALERAADRHGSPLQHIVNISISDKILYLDYYEQYIE
jgi:hypothetical protein